MFKNNSKLLKTIFSGSFIPTFFKVNFLLKYIICTDALIVTEQLCEFFAKGTLLCDYHLGEELHCPNPGSSGCTAFSRCPLLLQPWFWLSKPLTSFLFCFVSEHYINGIVHYTHLSLASFPERHVREIYPVILYSCSLLILLVVWNSVLRIRHNLFIRSTIDRHLCRFQF